MRNRISPRGPRFIVPAAVSPAATRIIRPTSLQPSISPQRDTRLPIGVCGGSSTSSRYWAKLKLRRGTRIKGLRYQHASSQGLVTSATLMRVRPDQGVEQWLIKAGSIETTPTDYEFSMVDGVVLAAGTDLVVKAGWTYYVEVEVESSHACAGKVVVVF